MADISLKVLGCSFPTPSYPYYHVKTLVEGFEEDLKIARIEGNGKWLRDYAVVNDGVTSPKQQINFYTDKAYLYIRYDWRNLSENTLDVVFASPDKPDVSYKASASFTAPNNGGYWNDDFKWYASLVVEENLGLERSNEPMAQVMAVYADRVKDPVKEVRVVEVDPVSGVHTEIPSQIYNVSRWEGFNDKDCQYTANFDVAFLANMKPYEKKVYLIFYGNDKAQKPEYKTDLYHSGEGLEQRIGNAYYEVKLQKESASIEDIILKRGVNCTFSHKLETNGAIQWNPDCYAPPTPWNHISDWDPPENTVFEYGPVFTMVKRWGSMPMYEDVKCSVTYMFYANNPTIILQSTIELTQDKDVIALRNGEIVLNREIVNEFAWKKLDGGIGTVLVDDVPRHPTMGKRVDKNTPWYAVFNREQGVGVGVVPIEAVNLRKDGGLERFDPFIYLQVGPWVYVARPLIYSFVSNNPQRVLHTYAGSVCYEKLAWLPFSFQDGDEMFDEIEKTNAALRAPLAFELFMDTDDRVPTQWVPPTLLAEFNEL
ncbi:MAG: hypothetical protein E7315_06325 [Clostridiales bacterium]|nr:hypothetical protein [Clostridiales bacterium]